MFKTSQHYTGRVTQHGATIFNARELLMATKSNDIPLLSSFSTCSLFSLCHLIFILSYACVHVCAHTHTSAGVDACLCMQVEIRAILFVVGDRACHGSRLSKQVKAGWLASPRNLLLQCWD